ncbi:MAG TPA: peptidase [Cellulomonas sp.]|nr:peptidase [Cellulomonas sp.]
MARIAKAGLAALAALVLMLLAPGSAMAGGPTSVRAASESPSQEATPSGSPTVYGCLVGEDGYGTKLPCELHVKVLEPICDNDVPKLKYEVEAVGSPNTKVKITWLNPGGDDYVQDNLPLSGTVLWPGAVQDADGNAVDWPGWRLEDGVWVEGDEFDWVRPSVSVLFQVNPEMTVNVAYPPSSPKCLTNPPEVLVSTPSPDPTTPDTEVLVDNPLPPEVAATGSNVAPLLIGAAVLVGGGLIAVLLVNRQRRRQV